MKTALSVLAIAITMSWVGPALDDHGYEQAMADELEQIQRKEQERQRFEQAAQLVCGENAGWYQLDQHTIQCTTKRGRATVKVAVAGL